MTKFHYTYRITNIRLNKHYYGCRSCICDPSDDLGKKYFSSSTDKNFIKDQKQNPQNYKYKVIKVFNSRKEAEYFETKLHEKFHVQINESFYNKAKNTLMGFSVEGRKQTAEHIKKRVRKGMVSAINVTTGELEYITSEEFNSNSNYIHILKGRKFTDEHRNNIRESRKGLILSVEHKESISKGTKKRCENEEFYQNFCETMTMVNKNIDKRKQSGEKIKEKWKEKEYLEKMQKRSHGSNSASLTDKWSDKEWKEYILECRRIKYEQRRTLYNLYDKHNNVLLKDVTSDVLRNIWNNLHKITKDKPLGSTRQSIVYLKQNCKLEYIGYYAEEIKSENKES